MTPEQKVHYERCLAEGTSPKLAEMFALGIPPMSNSDREYLEGRCNGNQFESQPWVGDLYRRRAADAGVSTTGMVYEPQLADYPGDPSAWVSGRGDVQRVCEERGWGCRGAVTTKRREEAPGPEIDVADDIVEETVVRRVEKDPSLGERPLLEVMHETKDQIKPHWSK